MDRTITYASVYILYRMQRVFRLLTDSYRMDKIAIQPKMVEGSEATFYANNSECKQRERKRSPKLGEGFLKSRCI